MFITSVDHENLKAETVVFDKETQDYVAGLTLPLRIAERRDDDNQMPVPIATHNPAVLTLYQAMDLMVKFHYVRKKVE